MRKLIVFFVALLFLVSGAYAQGPITGIISGRVFTPTLCGTAYANVTVDIGIGKIKGTSDCEGFFLFAGIPQGTNYQVTGKKPSLLPRTYTGVDVNAGYNTNVNILLGKTTDPDITNVTFPSCFSGWLTDEVTGNPILGAEVTAVHSSGQVFTAKTKANCFDHATGKSRDGCYEFNYVPNGTYSLSFVAPGYNTEYKGTTLKACSGYLNAALAKNYDCGLRIKKGTETIPIACEPPGAVTSPLRFANKGIVKGVILVDPSSSTASPIKIQTSSGIKALKRYVKL